MRSERPSSSAVPLDSLCGVCARILSSLLCSFLFLLVKTGNVHIQIHKRFFCQLGLDEENLKFSLFPRTHTCVVSAPTHVLRFCVGASALRARIESAGSHLLARLALGARTPRPSTRTAADLLALPRPAHVTTGCLLLLSRALSRLRPIWAFIQPDVPAVARRVKKKVRRV